MLAALVLLGYVNSGCANQARPHQHNTMTARLDKIAAPLLAKDMDIADTPVLLLQDNRANASTDGQAVYITAGLISRINDLALALIIAHELGHIALGHYWSDSPPRQLEQEADRYGLFLLARAGLDYHGAAQMPAAIKPPRQPKSTSSAGEVKRAEHFRAVIAEIEALKASGAPLFP